MACRGASTSPDSTEITWIVERHRSIHIRNGDSPLLLQGVDDLGMMDHFEVLPAIVAVFLTQSMEAMRAGGDDSLHTQFLEGREVRLG